jgi:hypothetical protein
MHTTIWLKELEPQGYETVDTEAAESFLAWLKGKTNAVSLRLADHRTFRRFDATQVMAVQCGEYPSAQEAERKSNIGFMLPEGAVIETPYGDGTTALGQYDAYLNSGRLPEDRPDAWIELRYMREFALIINPESLIGMQVQVIPR